MEAKYWIERWQEGKIGFHADEVNEQLTKFWPTLSVEKDCPVLVPLCGKSLDMVWLRNRGHPVIGIEASEIACRQFFEEQKRKPKITKKEDFKVFEDDGYRLYCGDFFDFTSRELPDKFSIFDRAALVALSKSARQCYAAKLSELSTNGTTMLLITLRYEQKVMEGPPFSIEPDEVRTLFSHYFNIQPLVSVNKIDHLQKFKDRGLKEVWEETYKLSRS